ncbi:TRAM domain-containing protein [Candidatus Saccharibacteria bacterium]|nr:TRAM domain-containing protein [Candidatus Saccharibacteria bacterium]
MTLIVISLLVLNLTLTTYLVYRSGIIRLVTQGNKPVFLDTSVLIDGRIEALARTGFLRGTYFIPRSVIAELQYMADSADGEKRTRARHGLDVAVRLQSGMIPVKLFQDVRVPKHGVDNQLLELAQKYGGAICTIDYNLNKVAQVESIPVLNINELAKVLRVTYLPGEDIELTVKQKGNEPNQGVAYLDDGTMVVIEQAGTEIGKNLKVEVIRYLQTDAGRMIFARKRKIANTSSKSNTAKMTATAKKIRSPRKPSAKSSSRNNQGSKEDELVRLANK